MPGRFTRRRESSADHILRRAKQAVGLPHVIFLRPRPTEGCSRPLWGTNHVVGNVVIERESPNGDVVARSRFHVMELRRDDVRPFAGSYVHHLKKTKNSYRIKLQRVDMTNALAAYDCVLQVWA